MKRNQIGKRAFRVMLALSLALLFFTSSLAGTAWGGDGDCYIIKEGKSKAIPGEISWDVRFFGIVNPEMVKVPCPDEPKPDKPCRWEIKSIKVSLERTVNVIREIPYDDSGATVARVGIRIPVDISINQWLRENPGWIPMNLDSMMIILAIHTSKKEKDEDIFYELWLRRQVCP